MASLPMRQFRPSVLRDDALTSNGARREFALRPNLHLVLDSGYIRQKGIVDMGPEL